MKSGFTKAAVLLMSCLTVFSSCKKEASNPVTREIEIAGFDKVAAGDDHEIVITPGATFSVQARGDATDISELRTTVTNGNLKIDYPNYRSNRKRVHIYIAMPRLKMADFGGASYGNISGFNSTDTIKVSLGGAAEFTVTANISLFDVNVTGTSSLTINGSAVKLVADASGQAKYYGYGLANTSTAFIWTSGQASAQVNVNNQLVADASGQSRIYYKGNPAQKTLTTTGQATIIQQ